MSGSSSRTSSLSFNFPPRSAPIPSLLNLLIGYWSGYLRLDSPVLWGRLATCSGLATRLEACKHNRRAQRRTEASVYDEGNGRRPKPLSPHTPRLFKNPHERVLGDDAVL